MAAGELTFVNDSPHDSQISVAVAIGASGIWCLNITQINGGQVGAADRNARYAKARRVFGA